VFALSYYVYFAGVTLVPNDREATLDVGEVDNCSSYYLSEFMY